MLGLKLIYVGERCYLWRIYALLNLFVIGSDGQCVAWLLQAITRDNG